ncbi:hypothetical protein [Mangrovicoccus sp. HB161399]|nr:hypothetical protein [Mangrovicoccus sp. HB161399]
MAAFGPDGFRQELVDQATGAMKMWFETPYRSLFPGETDAMSSPPQRWR